MRNENLSNKEILYRIGYFKNLKNISSYKLGLLLGHSETYFYRIESGKIQLTMPTFLEVLDILEVTTSEFFCPFIEEDKALIEKLQKTSEKNKTIINDILDKLT